MKTVTLKKTKKNVFKTNYRLMQVKVLQNAPLPLWLNAGQKYCRMLHGERSAILSTFIKLQSERSLFGLFLSDRLRQVLLYKRVVFSVRGEH